MLFPSPLKECLSLTDNGFDKNVTCTKPGHIIIVPQTKLA